MGCFSIPSIIWTTVNYLLRGGHFKRGLGILLFPPQYLVLGKYLQVSSGFLILVSWLNYLDTDGIIPLALLACALHELGHMGAIYLCGGRVQRVTLTVVGAELALPISLSYFQEFCCALAGPAVNLLLAWGCSGYAPLFGGLNLALACLNLLPLSLLDGGRALGCLLSLFLPFGWKEQVVALLDCFLAGGVVLAGLYLVLQGGSVTLLILGLWLWTGVHR